MVSYVVRGLFKTKWTWFGEPHEVSGVAEAVFFSYTDIYIPGFKKKKGDTTVIDLTKTEEELWEGMRKRFVRDQIEKGVENGIRVREGNLTEFIPIYDSFREAKNIPKSELFALTTGAQVFIAEQKGHAVSGGVFISDNAYARAFALASMRLTEESGRAREQIGFANRALIWHVIRAYKRAGVRSLDLGGLEAGDTSQARAFNEFKESFGGARRESFYYRKTYSSLLRLIRNMRHLI